MTTNQQPDSLRTLMEPKPRYRRVVDRMECPICAVTLGERYYDLISHEHRARVYTDDQQRNPPSAITTRTFHPCGCQDVAVIDISEAGRG